jgi:undecaprenyl phosphate N,N'-diacetylbacillosamine 1-phosphate transferase
MYRDLIKSIIDKILGFVMVIAVSPITLTISLVLAISNKGTPFFYQKRAGKSGSIFTIIKFKTLNDRRDSSGELLPDKERITSIGHLIRRASLDELPQLFNVLKGDMSLVGPRPLLVKYLSLYNSDQNRRHEVRPGITGWAQINGRNAVSWKEKFEMDVWYVDHLSFCLDMKILLITITKVFKREGINAPDAATMKPFTGN